MMPQVDRIERSYSTSSNGSSTTRRKVKRPLRKSGIWTLRKCGLLPSRSGVMPQIL